MNPRLLQSQIHADFSTGSGVWADYRTDVNGLFLSGFDTNFSDYRDHLIREYNRKINNLNQPTGLFIEPYDAGFRFIGNAGSYLFNGYSDCLESQQEIYTNSPVLAYGVVLYSDSLLQNVYNGSLFVYNDLVYVMDGNGNINSIANKLSNPYTVFEACNSYGAIGTLWIPNAPNSPTIGIAGYTACYADDAVKPNVGTEYYINFSRDNNGPSTVYITFDGGGIINNVVSCE
jgi:hypothetical protein